MFFKKVIKFLFPKKIKRGYTFEDSVPAFGFGRKQISVPLPTSNNDPLSIDDINKLMYKGGVVYVDREEVIRKSNKILAEIYKVAKQHDTGERQYKMTDMEYICKQCEKVIYAKKP